MMRDRNEDGNLKDFAKMVSQAGTTAKEAGKGLLSLSRKMNKNVGVGNVQKN